MSNNLPTNNIISSWNYIPTGMSSSGEDKFFEAMSNKQAQQQALQNNVPLSSDDANYEANRYNLIEYLKNYNFIDALKKNTERLGTGLVSAGGIAMKLSPFGMLTDPVGSNQLRNNLLSGAYNSVVGNYKDSIDKNGVPIGLLGGTVRNVQTLTDPIVSNWGLSSDQWGKVIGGEITPSQFAQNIGTSALHEPLNTAIDTVPIVASTKAGRAAVKGVQEGVKAVSPTPVKNLINRLQDAPMVERSLNAKNAELGSKKSTAIDLGNQAFNGLTKEEAIQVVKSTEENIPLNNPKLINAKENLRAQQKAGSSLIPEEFKANEKELSVNQYIARKTGRTIQDVRKELKAIDETIGSNVSKDFSTTDEAGEYLGYFESTFGSLPTRVPKTYDVSKYTKGYQPSVNKLIDGNLALGEQPEKISKALSELVSEEDLFEAMTKNTSQALNDLKIKYPHLEHELNKRGIKGIMETGADGLPIDRVFVNEGRYNPTKNAIINKSGKPESTFHEITHWFADEGIKTPNGVSKLEELTGLKVDKNFSETLAKKATEFAKNGTTKDVKLDNFFKGFRAGREVLEDSKLTAKQKELSTLRKEAEAAYDNGDIFPVTHAMSDSDKAAIGTISDEGRVFAGQYSSREFGLTPYETIVKEFEKTTARQAESLTRLKVEELISKEILDNGTLDGNKIVADITSNEPVAFLRKESLEKGNLKDALVKGLTNKDGRLLSNAAENYIPIRKSVADELKTQLGLIDHHHGKMLGDTETIIKQTMLAGLGYIGGNAITGAVNTLMNSGIHTVNDIMGALATRGRLAKNLGLYRYDTERMFSNNVVDKIIEGLDKTNKTFGIQYAQMVDRGLQNLWAEISSNAELRKAGLKTTEEKLRALELLAPDRVGQIVTNAKKTALINGTRALLPTAVTDVASGFMPFWRWTDTATQSALDMVTRNPVTANYIMSKIIPQLALDREQQNRMNLQVESNKPFVTYRNDPKTGNIREMTLEFLPIMNSIKFLHGVLGGDNDGVLQLAGWGDVMAATKGEDRYGRPLKNPEMINRMGKRYKVDDTGIHEFEGGTHQEIVSAIGRNTLAPINMLNKTVLPTANAMFSGITGEEYNFYNPNASSLIGTIEKQGERLDYPNFLIGGEPTKQRTVEDVARSFLGGYETDYYPEERQITPQQARNLVRGLGKSNMRYTQRAVENMGR